MRNTREDKVLELKQKLGLRAHTGHPQHSAVCQNLQSFIFNLPKSNIRVWLLDCCLTVELLWAQRKVQKCPCCFSHAVFSHSPPTICAYIGRGGN